MIGQTTDPTKPSRPTFAAIGSTCADTVPATLASTGPAETLSSVQLSAAGAAARNAATMKRSAVMRMRPPCARRGAVDAPSRQDDRVGRQHLQGSAQILVRLHVEPHREERELRAGDEQERDQHDGADAHLVPGDPVPELDAAEDEPHERREESEGVEEDEWVEVADDVLLAQPPEEAVDEQPRDPRHDFAVADP